MSSRLLHKWLDHQKALKLRDIAVSSGIASSGTKAVLIENVRNVLNALPHTIDHENHWLARPRKAMSVVSIDMGIRNLAYTHWTTTLKKPTPHSVYSYDRPLLKAWRKIDISKKQASKKTLEEFKSTVTHTLKRADKITTAPKESFEPIDYADHAYSFIKSIFEEHKPSHIIIERQRFRTGGHSAVQEWTLRVGVFEGMLYAVLKTLAAEFPGYAELQFEPVLPIRVNNYWSSVLADTGLNDTEQLNAKSGRQVKQAKIELVKEMLGLAEGRPQERIKEPLFTMDAKVADMASIFLANGKGVRKTSRRLPNPDGSTHGIFDEISKLDDLADCFLQGLAWLYWQNNQLWLAQLPQDTTEPVMPSIYVSV